MDRDRIVGSARDIAGKVEGAVGDIAGDANTSSSGRIREAAGKVQDMYGQAKDAARDAADTIGSSARQAANSDIVRDGSQAVAKLVQDNPLGSLMIAGAIGFTLALMLRSPAKRPGTR